MLCPRGSGSRDEANSYRYRARVRALPRAPQWLPLARRPQLSLSARGCRRAAPAWAMGAAALLAVLRLAAAQDVTDYDGTNF